MHSMLSIMAKMSCVVIGVACGDAGIGGAEITVPTVSRVTCRPLGGVSPLPWVGLRQRMTRTQDGF